MGLAVQGEPTHGAISKKDRLPNEEKKIDTEEDGQKWRKGEKIVSKKGEPTDGGTWERKI